MMRIVRLIQTASCRKELRTSGENRILRERAPALSIPRSDDHPDRQIDALRKSNIRLLLLPVLLLTGCATGTTILKIKSTPAPAKIEVNGQERCAETPCEVSLTCRAVYLSVTEPQFVTAFPKEAAGTLNPQYSYQEVCFNDWEQPKYVDVNFDLTLPQDGDFKEGSHVPKLLKKNYSLNLETIKPTFGNPKKYELRGVGLSMSKSEYSTDNFKVWSSINIFEGRDEDKQEPYLVNASGVGLSYLLNFHFVNKEAFFLSAGPMYLRQWSGNDQDTLGAYAGVGILFLGATGNPRLYPGPRKFQLGDLPMDATVNFGYFFQVSYPYGIYEKVSANATMYF